jgi:hypothetical protein
VTEARSSNNLLKDRAPKRSGVASGPIRFAENYSPLPRRTVDSHRVNFFSKLPLLPASGPREQPCNFDALLVANCSDGTHFRKKVGLAGEHIT